MRRDVSVVLRGVHRKAIKAPKLSRNRGSHAVILSIRSGIMHALDWIPSHYSGNWTAGGHKPIPC